MESHRRIKGTVEDRDRERYRGRDRDRDRDRGRGRERERWSGLLRIVKKGMA